MLSKPVIATILALVACAFWSGNFVIARGVHEWMPPITLAFGRWLVALVLLLPFIIQRLPREWPIIRKNWLYLVLMGVFGVGMFNTLIYFSAQLTTAHHIGLISSTAPIGTLLLAGLLRIEQLTVYKTIGACCAFAGAVVVVTYGDVLAILDQLWNRGDLLLLATAVIWAVWSVALRYKPAGISGVMFLASTVAIGVLSLLPFYLWERQFYATPMTVQAVTIYLYMGIGGSVIGWLCWQYAVQHIGAVKTSILYYSLPIFSSALAVIYLQEPLELYHIIGFLLVVSGIVLSNWRKLAK